MKSTFLRSGADFFRALVECASWAQSWKFCTSYGAVAASSHFGTELEPHLPKLKYAIVGTDLHRSDPGFLQWLDQSEKLRVHANPESGFGPNVFLFHKGEESRVIVGGAALDDVAISSAFQAAVMTACDRHAAFALAAEEFFHRCLRASHLPTTLDIEQYTRSHAEIHPTLVRARAVPWRRPTIEAPDDDDSQHSADELSSTTDGETDAMTNDKPRDDQSIDLARRHASDTRIATVDDGEPDESDTDESDTDESDTDESDTDDGDSSDGDEAARTDHTRTRLEDCDVSEIMIAFRTAAREGGVQSQEQLLREVARRFGYERLGKRIEQQLRGHLRAAIRRQIIRRREEDDCLCLDCRDIAEYDAETRVKTVLAVMRAGTWCDRQVVVRESANYLGFVYITESVAVAMRNAIRTALRRGELLADGTLIRKG